MSAGPDDCIHLTLQIVREIHSTVLKEFGGTAGVRDEGLLAAAVAAPQATSGGKSPFHDLVEVAAAYLFYLYRNHPFLDGNKRTAMTAAIVFLRLNGIEPGPDAEEWGKLLLEVAASKLESERTATRLRKLISRKA
jgi:death on curing protein